MTPERHRQIMELFDRACELAGSARAELLAGVCGSDPELRREVESLLAHHDQPSTVADRAASGLWVQHGDPVGVEPTDQRPAALPARIGQYRPIRVLGTGSMGIVYEAEQERPARRVAVKVLHDHHLPTELVRRFEREAELLGRMRHPGVAQILEAGSHQGLPFLAMELVHGVPFDVAARGLDRRACLELLARVADAVQHAHDKGVIHRDLKPGNVLVDENLQPKVLDFGIARLTDAEARSRTAQTVTGQLVGTLDYMSPEQLGDSGEQVDARSDVYGLGVMLFQALTRALPHDLAGKSFATSVLLLRTTEPRRIESVDPTLRGDIATIVHTAVSREPGQRYSSAAALAADIRRYLAHQPIVARPPSTIYLLHRFARRHRLLVGAALTTVVALIAGLSVALAGWRRASIERDRAAAARDESDAVTRFLVRAIEAANPDGGTQRTVRDLLDGLAPTIAIENGHRPRVEARLALAAASSFLGLSDVERAQALLAGARKAADRLEERDPELDLQIDAGLAEVERRNGNFEAALAKFEQLVGRAQAELGPHHALTLDLRERRGNASLRLGHYAATRADLEAVIARRIVRAAEEPFPLATSRLNLGLVLARLGEEDEALQLLETTIAELRAGGLGSHPFVANALLHLAELRMHRGQLEVAEGACAESLAMQQQIYDRPQEGTASAMIVLARIKHRLGRNQEAVDLAQQALAAREAMLPAEHPEVVGAIHKLAEFQLAGGDVSAAEATLRRGLDRVPADAADKTVRGWMLDVYGRVLGTKGDFLGAEAALREAKDRIVAARGEDHPDVLVVSSNLGLVLYQAGKLEDASEALSQVLSLRERNQPADHPDLIVARQNLGMLAWQMGDLARARELFHAARTASERTRGAAHPGTFELAVLEARQLRRLGRVDEAEALFARVQVAEPGQADQSTAIDARIELAHVAADRGDGTSAARWVADARAMGSTDPVTLLNLRIAAARVATVSGQHDEAERDLLEVMRIFARIDRLRAGSEHLDAWRALVEVYERKGDHESAATWRSRRP